MKQYIALAVVLAAFSLGDAYSKYGRTCKDIGCGRNEQCVMLEDPCQTYSAKECGRYPDCQKVSNAAASCQGYICPPTQLCRMDKGEPKCFPNPAATNTRTNTQLVENYNPGAPIGETPNAPSGYPQQPNYPPQTNYPQQPHNPPQTNYPQNPGHNPNYPQNPGAYPNLRGQTTPRPNVYQPGQHASGGGYQGVAGSGYPGQTGQHYGGAGGYQGASGSGYPGQIGRVAQPSFPGQPSYGGAGQGGYPRQPGQGYQQPGGYQQGGYYNQQPNKPKNDANPIIDRITNTLKTIGLFWFVVKYMAARMYGM